jgi:transcriptional regulator with XRE-family HTH domain
MSSPVGTLLAHWRDERRMSQLRLSHEAGVTQRHVSFIESGRSQPSREMVLSLARALDVPMRERNQMLLAAGYAPQYRETGLDDDAMAQVRAALHVVLDHHDPHPAVVMNRHWDIVLANAAATAMFAFLMRGTDEAHSAEPANVVRLMFTALRPYVANWDQTGETLLQRVHREAVGGVPDPQTARLLSDVLALPGVPDAWRRPDFISTPLPIVPIAFARGGIEVSYFSMVTTVGTPSDITLQELRIEAFFPADDATAVHRWT